MRFDGWTLVLQTVNFAVLVWLLHRFLYRPILAMIDARGAAIRKQMDDARAEEQRAAADRAAIDAQRAGIAAERDAALKTAAQQADQAARARREKAEREAQAIIASAHESIATEREQALDELCERALDLAADLARRVLADVPLPLRAEAWMERIEHYLRALAPAEREELVRSLAEGRAVEVTTAVPLPEEIAEAWRARLRGVLGDDAKIAFATDAAVVAGAELHFPTAILRFSARGALDAMRSTMRRGVDA
jgi:F-type H+-transporting ATPase subunit b